MTLDAVLDLTSSWLTVTTICLLCVFVRSCIHSFIRGQERAYAAHDVHPPDQRGGEGHAVGQVGGRGDAHVELGLERIFSWLERIFSWLARIFNWAVLYLGLPADLGVCILLIRWQAQLTSADTPRGRPTNWAYCIGCSYVCSIALACLGR